MVVIVKAVTKGEITGMAKAITKDNRGSKKSGQDVVIKVLLSVKLLAK